MKNVNLTYRPQNPPPSEYRVVRNPFDYSAWAFYVIHVSGQIIGYSNSEAWCEEMIRRTGR